MEIQQAYKRADGTYVVDGYHVCPKSIDPYGKYDIAEVEAYLLDHPEALIDEPMPPEPTKAEKNAMEVQWLQAYLANNDWYATRKIMTGKDIPKDVLIKCQEARDRISEIKSK